MTSNPNTPRIYAAAGTLVLAALIIMWLLLSHLSLVPHARKASDITLAMVDEEEFVEVIPDELPQQPQPEQEAAPAQNEVTETNRSVAAPAPGQDLANNGPVGKPAPPVAQPKPSPVKTEKTKEPTPEEIAAREEQRRLDEARRQATNAVGSAFSDNGGKNNTNSSTGSKPGNSGSPAGKPSQGNAHGVSVSSRGVGGWGAPSRSSVAMSQVGQITVEFDLKPDGTIANFNVVSNKTQPPSYTSNTKVINALKAEIAAFYKRQAQAGKGEKQLCHGYITYIIK